ncbi:hypothetical protein [Numidum massiliense]|uniref:hypothetical protein n=1 Tax=Numidum massiliense TaxID=1522315 RepID=UPI0012FB30C3|nr:hypothetical protein [Numidum massiliense]
MKQMCTEKQHANLLRRPGIEPRQVGIDSHRADIVLIKTAMTLAAMDSVFFAGGFFC